jgi:hypothetical protein
MIERALEAKKEQHRAQLATQKEHMDAMLARQREEITADVTTQVTGKVAQQMATYEARIRVLERSRPTLV